MASEQTRVVVQGTSEPPSPPSSHPIHSCQHTSPSEHSHRSCKGSRDSSDSSTDHVDIRRQVGAAACMSQDHPLTLLKPLMDDQDFPPTEPPGTKRPNDYQYTITSRDDNFEAIDAERRPNHAKQDSLDESLLIEPHVDEEAMSDGRASIRTLSACGESDSGETISSVDNDFESEYDHVMDTLSYPDPIKPPLPEQSADSDDSHPDIAASSERLVNDESSADDKTDEIAESGITVLADPKPTKSASCAFTEPLEHQPEYMARVSRFAQYLQSGLFASMRWLTDPTKTKAIPEFCKGNEWRKYTSSAVALLLLSVLLTFSYSPPSVGLSHVKTYVSTLSSFSEVLTGDREAVPAITPAEDRTLRYALLEQVLARTGMHKEDGSPIIPSEILAYPTVYTLGDQELTSQPAFQTGVTARLIAPDQLFLSLPRELSGRKYLREPRVRITSYDVDVAILKQENLIDGLVRLVFDPSPAAFRLDVAVECQHVNTTIHAYQERHLRKQSEKVSAMTKHLQNARCTAGGFGNQLQIGIAKGINVFGKRFGELSHPIASKWSTAPDASQLYEMLRRATFTVSKHGQIIHAANRAATARATQDIRQFGNEMHVQMREKLFHARRNGLAILKRLEDKLSTSDKDRRVDDCGSA